MRHRTPLPEPDVISPRLLAAPGGLSRTPAAPPRNGSRQGQRDSFIRTPADRHEGNGVAISARIASKTTLNSASYFFSGEGRR
jgi:hypothetical protein